MIHDCFKNLLLGEQTKEGVVISTIDMYFIYAAMWSLGASIDEESQKEFAYVLREKGTELQKIDGGKEKGGKDFKVEKKNMMPEMG